MWEKQNLMKKIMNRKRLMFLYKINSWETNLLEIYSVNNTDGTYNCSLQFRLFKTPELAIQYSMDISNNKNMKCIVAQWYADIDRH